MRVGRVGHVRMALGLTLTVSGLLGMLWSGRGNVAQAVAPDDPIAYVSAAPDGGIGIFAATVDASVATQLTLGPDDRHPSWAPDGTALAFEQRSVDGSRVVIVDLATSGTRSLVEGAERPAWSPAGDRIAVQALDDAGVAAAVDVYLVDGTFQERTFLGEVSSIAWSADGAVLAAQTAAGVFVWTGTGIVPVASGTLQAAFALSPDGTSVAFVESRSAPGLGITTSLVIQEIGGRRLDLDTGTTLLGTRVTMIAWSPDGARLAWSTQTAAGSAVHVINADGSGAMTTLLESAGNVITVEGWSPDSDSLLLTTGQLPTAEPPIDPTQVSLQIGVVDADGANLSWLLFGSQPTFAPAAAVLVPGPGPSPVASPSPSPTPTPTVAPTPTPAATPTPGPTEPPPPLASPTPRALRTFGPQATPSPSPTPTPRSDFMVRSIPPPSAISTDPVIVATSAVAATGVLLLIPFPSQLFNSTLDHNRERITAGFGRVRRRTRTGAGRMDRFWATPLGFVMFVVLAALLGALLDPRLGFDARSIATVLGMGLGIVVVATTFALPELLARRRRGRPVRFRVVPSGLLVSAAGMLVSRFLTLVPGYLYGVILGVGDDEPDTEAVRDPAAILREEGRSTAIGAAWSLGLALFAWVLSWPLTVDSAGIFELPLLVVRTALWAMVVAGIESVVFGFLPVRFMPGEKVFRWNKVAWGLLLGIALFAFLHVLVNPSAGYLTDQNRVPFATAIAALVLFGGGSVAFWAWFRFRPLPTPPSPPTPDTEPADAPEEPDLSG